MFTGVIPGAKYAEHRFVKGRQQLMTTKTFNPLTLIFTMTGGHFCMLTGVVPGAAPGEPRFDKVQVKRGLVQVSTGRLGQVTR